MGGEFGDSLRPGAQAVIVSRAQFRTAQAETGRNGDSDSEIAAIRLKQTR
jgi:hypothetical protein